MLNDKKERELAYVVKIDEIQPIEGADRVELALVNGWRVMVRKGQFQPNDYAIYFEIDSKVPEIEPFMFLAQKHFKIKTQKYFKGTVISQGLLMSFEDFRDENDLIPSWLLQLNLTRANGGEIEGTFLTKDLGVTYAVAEDNVRKAASANKYAKMVQRHKALFNKQPYKWLLKREWGKKLLFAFYGKKKDTRGWPQWVVKTDEERVQNMPWILENKEPWIATEKIDGTSTTFTMKRNKKLIGKDKYDFYVCSRNVVFDKPEKECFYDTNVYLEMAEQYKVEKVLTKILDSHPEYEWVTIQGETYGEGIQKRNYHNPFHAFMAFNFITSVDGRWNSVEAAKYLNDFDIPWVPILDTKFILPDTVDELLEIATDESVLDTDLREGIVFRSQDGLHSFKAVSNEFLLKYHQ